MRFRFFLPGCFALVFAGCGGGESFVVADNDATADTTSDDANVDSTTDTGTVMDTGHVVDDPCSGKPNGTTCSSLGGFLCVSQSCVPTSCGDGYVDKAAGEECEDGNDVNGDGCDKCHFTCKKDDVCDDGTLCNGKETCDLTKHVCKSGTNAADGTACTLTDGSAGSCNGGTCAKAGCGNGTLNAGEECDDGNAVNGDGCNNDCTYSCKSNDVCDDKNVCNGVEVCDLVQHKCTVSAPALNCDDGLACTSDTCDATLGCQNTKIDADGDGHSCSDDCDDSDPSVYVGAPELCDGKDNDCNGKVDDGMVVMATCYPDADGDGYGVTSGSTISACTCPVGTTPTAPTDKTTADCFDGNKSVHPKEETFFSVPYCADPSSTGTTTCGKWSFDYNCNGTEDKQLIAIFSGSCPLAGGTTCTSKGGWKDFVPACGVAGTYIQCVTSGLGCKQTTTFLKQACR